jgi:hypothetical protein
MSDFRHGFDVPVFDRFEKKLWEDFSMFLGIVDPSS